MYNDKKTAVIIAAAGMGRRLGGSIPKQFMDIGGQPVVARTLKVFEAMDEIDHIFIVTNEDYMKHCEKLTNEYGISKLTAIVKGGAERQDSVYNALKAVAGIGETSDACSSDTAGIDGCIKAVDYVLIHDGARPFVSRQVILNVLEGIMQRGAAVACVPMKDSLRRTSSAGGAGRNEIGGADRDASAAGGSCADQQTAAGSYAVDRSQYFAVQTPQGFILSELLHAYEKAYEEGYYGTDDASLAERVGMSVAIVDGDYGNIKITTREDLPMEYRVGTGFDVHKFEVGRKLILGGVDVPYEKGLAGHSDADVLVHALMDALLGAAALGDIGRHFPDTDQKYKGISSLKLLEHVGKLLADEGYTIGNVDVTVIAQAPKIAPHIEAMAGNIAEILKLQKSRINIKGTTTEKLGFTGRKEGIAAEAVCVLYR